MLIDPLPYNFGLEGTPRKPLIFGTWLSLVEHSLGVRGVGSSNLPVPTKISTQLSAVSIQLQQSPRKNARGISPVRFHLRKPSTQAQLI